MNRPSAEEIRALTLQILELEIEVRQVALEGAKKLPLSDFDQPGSLDVLTTLMSRNGATTGDLVDDLKAHGPDPELAARMDAYMKRFSDFNLSAQAVVLRMMGQVH